MDFRLKLSGMTAGLLQPLCHAPTPPHPGPLPQGEREEAQAGKPVRGLSSQEKKGRSPPPAPPVFPPPTGAEKTEESQGGHRGLSCPPALLSFPPVVSGNPSSEEGGRGRGNAEKARGGRETGPVLLPLPLRERPGVRGGNGQLARVAPSMSGNDVVSGEDRRLPTYAGTDSFLAA